MVIAEKLHLYHLSYDIIYQSTIEDSEREKEGILLTENELYKLLENKRVEEHESLKIDIITTILKDNENLHVFSPVASTIIFCSPDDFNSWQSALEKFKGRMYYFLSEVKDLENSIIDNKKFMNAIGSINEELANNFYNEFILRAKLELRILARLGGKATRDR